MRHTLRVQDVVSPFSSLYAHLNRQFFDDALPPCEIRWSRQLTRAAGNIDVRNRRIKLSVPILVEGFSANSAVFEVCGVSCSSRDEAIWEILKHEMIHLWLYEEGLPYGHTAAFRAKARSIGQSKIRHGIALPLPTSGWIYFCPVCTTEMTRRKRFGRPVACGKCCKKHSGGQFDARFQLKGRRISAPHSPTANKPSR